MEEVHYGGEGPHWAVMPMKKIWYCLSVSQYVRLKNTVFISNYLELSTFCSSFQYNDILKHNTTYKAH